MSSHTKYIVIAERQDHAVLGELPVRTPDEYLEGEAAETVAEDIGVVNLCRSYQYLSRGYYVSLLADARHQRAFPTLRMIEEITNPYAYFTALRGAGVETIDFRVVRGRRVLPKLIVPAAAVRETGKESERPLVSKGVGGEPARYEAAPGDFQEVTCVAGRTRDARFRKHCSAIFKVYPFPLLRVRLYREEDRWKTGQIFPLSLGTVAPEDIELLRDTVAVGKLAASAALPDVPPHRIAVLMDEDEPFSPSGEDTFERLRKVGERRGVLYEWITKDDLPSLPEYDALFIRTVTGMDHYSFMFAQRAKSLGIPVIDEPQSTVRCSNKVYLYELFRKAGLPTPRTLTISRKSPIEEAESLGYPLIVKQPDGTFSAAVKKAENRAELQKLTREMFKRSPLLTLQEFRPTEFDWRIGILDGSVLYACKYFMVKGHWQIVDESSGGRLRYGDTQALPLDAVPKDVKSLALGAAALIGDGLYGVDVKETEAGPVVIEVNDNPDLWVGGEDAVEGDRLYDRITEHFLRRIQEMYAEPEPA
jgi:glutathione synthase/RimK-type ligase-like ATP-grasp enzyme